MVVHLGLADAEHPSESGVDGFHDASAFGACQHWPAGFSVSREPCRTEKKSFVGVQAARPCVSAKRAAVVVRAEKSDVPAKVQKLAAAGNCDPSTAVCLHIRELCKNNLDLKAAG